MGPNGGSAAMDSGVRRQQKLLWQRPNETAPRAQMVRRRDGFQQHFSRRTLIKKKTNFPHIKEIEIRSSWKVIYEEGLPNLWGNAQIFNHRWGGRSSYMTLQLIPSEFPYIWINLIFFFISAPATRATTLYQPRRCWAQTPRTVVTKLYAAVVLTKGAGDLICKLFCFVIGSVCIFLFCLSYILWKKLLKYLGLGAVQIKREKLVLKDKLLKNCF
jgi:hypothetical protein